MDPSVAAGAAGGWKQFLIVLRQVNLRNKAEYMQFGSCSLAVTVFFFFSLAGISDEDIINVTLPTGVPILLELDENLRPLGPHQFLGDQEAIQAAIKKVEDQGKVKSTEK